MDRCKIRRLKESLSGLNTMEVTGVVHSASGLTVLATLAGARIGEQVVIETVASGSLPAEVIGFEGSRLILIPFGRMEGIGSGDRVRRCGRPMQVPCGESLVGRILDGFGNPMDGRPLPADVQWRSFHSPPPDPLSRLRIREALPVGIKTIDALLTIGKGQRVGLFAGSGVGKSILIGQIARQSAADRIVIGLIGERGREVREFVEDNLGEEGLRRSVVVCATSDSPPMARYKAGLTATVIAEWFRDSGRNVLLLIDSVTRLARALREIGLAAGEAPTRRGFPPSVFTRLSEMLERSGNSSHGVMTAIYTVLVEGGDMDEPIADEVRGILDGHIVLDRRIAERGLLPPIDPLQSISRVMPAVVKQNHLQAAKGVLSILSCYEQNRDLIQIGAYKRGSDMAIDRAIRWIGQIEAFMRQDSQTHVSFEESVDMLTALWKKASL